jgi:amino acid transporter
MKLLELLIGRPLRTEEEQIEQIGPAAGIPVLGLDALGSASYGPEAVMTVLLPLGLAATGYIGPITFCIVGLLFAVFLSYLQTIPAYPAGGGSYTVAKENLGPFSGVLAATALCLDYILNVAVAIAAGTGALVSVMPSLLPYTLWICLGLLALLTVINLRGIRTTGILFMAPTYLFVGTLLVIFLIGIAKALSNGGHPYPVVAPPMAKFTTQAAGVWILLHAFASGCTALTGVEAVSNAVPIFRRPTVRNAKVTLTSLVLILTILLAGIAFLSRAYGITATIPGQTGYQSILSQIVSAVVGRSFFYYVTMFSVIAVLCLSANTSFADFPRVCRVLALDDYLPPEFAHRGSRLVYTSGILVLTIFAGVLLIAFQGVTDRLIPLFAVGAFGAFTMSQIGMIVHWRKLKQQRRTASLVLNAIGACITTVTLIVIVVAKFKEWAWLVLVVLPPMIFFLHRVRKYQTSVDVEISSDGPVDFDNLPSPIVVVPLKRLDSIGRKALRLALRLTPDVHAVQVLSEAMKTENLEASWKKVVADPAQEAGYHAPKLIVVTSVYREFFGPFLKYLAKVAKDNPERPIGVMVPELVERRWYHFFFRHRATLLKGLILMKGGPQLFIINTPWYVEKHAALPQSTTESAPARVASG